MKEACLVVSIFLIDWSVNPDADINNDASVQWLKAVFSVQSHFAHSLMFLNASLFGKSAFVLIDIDCR